MVDARTHACVRLSNGTRVCASLDSCTAALADAHTSVLASRADGEDDVATLLAAGHELAPASTGAAVVTATQAYQSWVRHSMRELNVQADAARCTRWGREPAQDSAQQL